MVLAGVVAGDVRRLDAIFGIDLGEGAELLLDRVGVGCGTFSSGLSTISLTPAIAFAG